MKNKEKKNMQNTNNKKQIVLVKPSKSQGVVKSEVIKAKGGDGCLPIR
ncbi:MAG: hypothetical protein HUU56_00595 [Bdellovibrionaceae bacterium]|nr:hypothetical protein [Pseudobdellovibrionaceae bacterium]